MSKKIEDQISYLKIRGLNVYEWIGDYVVESPQNNDPEKRLYLDPYQLQALADIIDYVATESHSDGYAAGHEVGYYEREYMDD